MSVVEKTNELPTEDSLNPSMKDFFQQIKSITEDDEESEESEESDEEISEEVLEKTSKEDNQLIYELILEDAKENIKIAAMQHYNEAFIFIYETSTYYKNIPIDSLLNMPKYLQDIYQKFHITSVMERVKETMKPFEIELRTVYDELYHVKAVVAKWN